MSYPAKNLSENEQVILSFRPHWRSLILPALWTLVAVGGTIFLFTSLPDIGTTFKRIAAGVLAVGWLVFGLAPFVRWWFSRHVLTDERLIVRRGVIARHGMEIPLEVIQNVGFSQTVIERMLGYGDLLVESAGQAGQSRLSNIPHPERFQKAVYAAREARAKDLTGANVASLDSLAKLAELHKAGVISAEEFEEKKAKLLGQL